MKCAGQGKTPYIDKEKCLKCAECKPAQGCLNRAFTRDPEESEYPFVKNDRCRSCGACVSACPWQAVRLS